MERIRGKISGEILLRTTVSFIRFKLDLRPYLEKKANILVDEYSNKIFEKVLSIEIEERRKAIKNIKNDLKLFEQKYNMSTEKFYKK